MITRRNGTVIFPSLGEVILPLRTGVTARIKEQEVLLGRLGGQLFRQRGATLAHSFEPAPKMRPHPRRGPRALWGNGNQRDRY